MEDKMISNRMIIIASIIFLIILVFILWANGIFYIADRQISPNGNITTTVYTRDVSKIFPKNNGFTIKSSGDFKGTKIYTDGSEFENMWWSPDSKYQVISIVFEKGRLLELKEYQKNSIANLNLYINMNMSSHEEFIELMPEEKHWKTLQFDFVNWKEEHGGMTVRFEFEDYMGNQQKGKLDFNCQTGVVSNIEFK